MRKHDPLEPKECKFCHQLVVWKKDGIDPRAKPYNHPNNERHDCVVDHQEMFRLYRKEIETLKDKSFSLSDYTPSEIRRFKTELILNA